MSQRKKAIQKEKQYFKLNENENITSMSNVDKAKFSGKLIV